MNNKELIMFKTFLNRLDGLKSIRELKKERELFNRYFKNFNTYYKGIELLEKKEILIKISKIKDNNLRFNISGLYNILYDNNKIYNSLYTRENIINDLLKFKGLNFLKFKTLNLEEKKKLNKRFSFLAVKADCKPFYTKVYRIKKGFYVLKTLETDNITVSVFYYKSNDLKSLFNKYSKQFNFNKTVGDKDKFNFSSLNAFRELNKEDNMRFYAYCNRMGLDKKNRDLLRSIRKNSGGKTFYCYIEELESEQIYLNKLIDNIKLFHQLKNMNINLKGLKLSFSYNSYLNLLSRQQEVENLLIRFSEEDNSLEDKTKLENMWYY